jgi:hypothetical protein
VGKQYSLQDSKAEIADFKGVFDAFAKGEVALFDRSERNSQQSMNE